MTDRPVDAAAIADEVASCAASQAALVDHVRSFSEVDPTEPSLLPGWTIGHVMTHIARNGDSVVDMLAGRPQYPSFEARNAAIEEGAPRPWAALVADVESSAAAAITALESHRDWPGTARTMGGEQPFTYLPLLRQREVEVHRVDLGLGHSFDDMPAGYVRRDLRVLGMMWSARKPMGMTTLPDLALAADPHLRHAWLMGRAAIEGLQPAGLF